jgi:antitoxin MazE
MATNPIVGNGTRGHSWIGQIRTFSEYWAGVLNMRVKLAKWGNSLGVRIPKAVAEAIGLKAGMEIEVTVDEHELRIRQSIPFKHYRLEDLVAEMDRLGPENQPETVDWGPDVGAEIIDDAYSRGEITLDDLLKNRS